MKKIILNERWNQGILISSESEEVEVFPDWTYFKKLVWNNKPLYFSIANRANPNIFTSILKIITDGESGKGDEFDLGGLLNTRDENNNHIIGFEWSANEIQIINSYLEASNFEICII